MLIAFGVAGVVSCRYTEGGMMKCDLSLVQPGKDEAQRASQRLVLYADELYRVPTDYAAMRVVAGAALVTHAARDLILSAGSEAALQQGKDAALVSPLRGETVVIELYGRRRQSRI